MVPVAGDLSEVTGEASEKTKTSNGATLAEKWDNNKPFKCMKDDLHVTCPFLVAPSDESKYAPQYLLALLSMFPVSPPCGIPR